ITEATGLRGTPARLPEDLRASFRTLRRPAAGAAARHNVRRSRCRGSPGAFAIARAASPALCRDDTRNRPGAALVSLAGIPPVPGRTDPPTARDRRSTPPALAERRADSTPASHPGAN